MCCPANCTILGKIAGFNVNLQRLHATLLEHEGLRLKAYDDRTGRTLERGAELKGNPTIGVGRNLIGLGITKHEAYYLLDQDIERVSKELFNQLPWFESLDSVRQEVLANMCFNMGISTLLTFRTMLSAISHHHYEHASTALLDSRYAKQVWRRAYQLADALRHGKME